MNINIKSAYSRIVTELKVSFLDISTLGETEELLDSTKEKIETTLEKMEHSINELEWMNETVSEFLIELRDRKSEGEVVIDELITVLCLEKM